ncbi:hypothetical protein UJ101_00288 [Flavobacteriaceae bacterium UJ101]|nr:hypothetical protein UJ101_00288 [Flavobacteriaceae bacterium UJ101]
MRVIILGDIHGNLPALEKVLKIEHNNFDLLVCHGDVVNYAPWSNECVQLLDTIDNKVLLKGNHEVNYLNKNYKGTHIVAQTFFDVCFPKFKEFDRIKDYKETYTLGDFTIQHTINDQYVYPDTDLQELNLNKNYIIGHSHYAFDRTENGNRIINTGSLGQNRVFINESNYIIYDLDKEKVQKKDFINNFDLVIEKMKALKYPELCLNYYLNKKRR